MDFFDVDVVFFTVLNYSMSYIEFFGTISGAVAVWLTSRANVWGWPIGLVNVVLFFFLFYQVQLYPDMFLQVFYLVTNLMGWWRWKHPKDQEVNVDSELKISLLPIRQVIFLIVMGTGATIMIGFFSGQLHIYLPALFKLPSAFPFADSFIIVFSVIATFLTVEKKIECWIIWIAVDVIASAIYYLKNIKFVAIEYAGFCLIAALGFHFWLQAYKRQNEVSRPKT